MVDVDLYWAMEKAYLEFKCYFRRGVTVVKFYQATIRKAITGC